MPLSAEDIEKGRLEQFPTAMGAIVLTVNVPGIENKQLNPTGPLVAAIFMGKVSRWNDRRIAELNPGVNLPNLPVAPVHRADASGTTFQFTDYLAKVSEEWKSRVGQGRPFAGLRGSAPTATMVSPVPCATRGAIGYVEYAYAKLNRLVSTQLQNREGNFVVPSKALFQAAVDNADWSSAPHFGISLNDQPGKDSWPIIAPRSFLFPSMRLTRSGRAMCCASSTGRSATATASRKSWCSSRCRTARRTRSDRCGPPSSTSAASDLRSRG